MADGSPIIIGQANTASNPGARTSLSRNETSSDHTFLVQSLNRGTAIRGEATRDFGVVGTSDSGYGMYGNSNSSTGVAGTSASGAGVYGTSSRSTGVTGTSAQLNGVQGESSSHAASGVYGENLSGGGFGVAGRSNAPGVDPGAPGWGAGVLGDNTAGGDAGFFNGSVRVRGPLFKSGGGFAIDNPVDPANSYLYHCFVESPDMMNVYNGNVTTDADGNATVELPGYFEALNREFRYQLTAVGQFAQAIVAEEVRGNRFRLKTDKPNVKVSWQVTGIRQDAWANAHRTEAEVEKSKSERGKYLTPTEHGQPAAAGIYYVDLPVSEETEVDSGQRQGEYSPQLPNPASSDASPVTAIGYCAPLSSPNSSAPTLQNWWWDLTSCCQFA